MVSRVLVSDYRRYSRLRPLHRCWFLKQHRRLYSSVNRHVLTVNLPNLLEIVWVESRRALPARMRLDDEGAVYALKSLDLKLCLLY